MRLIRPQSVTDATLTSSSVTEADYPVWNAATAYILGDRVIRTTGVHKIFERIIAGTTATPPENDPTNWLDIGATNRWKMFDAVVGSQTTKSDSIVVTITPWMVVNAVALLNVVAQTVRVKMTDTIDGVVYDSTVEMLDNSLVTDWWHYFFEPIVRRQDVVFLDLPSYGTASIEITITNTGDTAACGVAVLGVAQTIGDTMMGASVGIRDYSRKEQDAFGNFIIVPRTFSKRANFQLKVQRNKTDGLQKLLAELRTTPVVYIGSDSFESTIVYGYYRDFDIVISSIPLSDCNIEIEGLT